MVIIRLWTGICNSHLWAIVGTMPRSTFVPGVCFQGAAWALGGRWRGGDAQQWPSSRLPEVAGQNRLPYPAVRPR